MNALASPMARTKVAPRRTASVICASHQTNCAAALSA